MLRHTSTGSIKYTQTRATFTNAFTKLSGSGCNNVQKARAHPSAQGQLGIALGNHSSNGPMAPSAIGPPDRRRVAVAAYESRTVSCFPRAPSTQRGGVWRCMMYRLYGRCITRCSRRSRIVMMLTQGPSDPHGHGPTVHTVHSTYKHTPKSST